MCDMYAETCFSQEMITNVHATTIRKQHSMEWKHADSLVKKGPLRTSKITGYADNIMGHERTHHC